MRNTIYSLLLAPIILLTVVSCQKKVTAASKGIRFDTLRVDTTAMLTDTARYADILLMVDSLHTNDSCNASCRVSLDLIFFKGQEFSQVNDSILRSGLLAPEYLSLSHQKMTPAAAVDSFIYRYINDYRDFYSIVYAEEANDTTASISYCVTTELRDGRSGITNYIAHVRTNQGSGESDYTQVFNIDINNNRLLRLSDVFLDGYEQPLGEIIMNRLAWQFDVKSLAGLRQLGYFVQCDPYPTANFEMTDRRMRFIYLKGEIADREKGETVVEVPYSQLKNIMRK